MKKIACSFVFILMTTILSPAFAAEGVLPDPVSAQSVEDDSHYFGLIVTGTGKLMIKPGAVFTQGDDVEGMELPYLLDHPKPISYPHWLVSKGWEGKLIVAIEIRTDGSVGLYQIMKSTGHSILDQEAVGAVQDWKFKPALKDGKPVRTCIQIPITFQLEEE